MRGREGGKKEVNEPSRTGERLRSIHEAKRVTNVERYDDLRKGSTHPPRGGAPSVVGGSEVTNFGAERPWNDTRDGRRGWRQGHYAPPGTHCRGLDNVYSFEIRTNRRRGPLLCARIHALASGFVTGNWGKRGKILPERDMPILGKKKKNNKLPIETKFRNKMFTKGNWDRQNRDWELWDILPVTGRSEKKVRIEEQTVFRSERENSVSLIEN